MPLRVEFTACVFLDGLDEETAVRLHEEGVLDSSVIELLRLERERLDVEVIAMTVVWVNDKERNDARR